MERNKSFKFRAKLWLYEGEAGWHFVTVPKRVGKEISTRTMRIGFGSIPVLARIDAVECKTSIFPDSKSGSYLLPVKAQVRKIAGIEEGDQVIVLLGLR